MNCPYCSKEMRKGFLNQSDAIYPIRWRPMPQEEPVLFYSNKDSIKLTAPFKSGRVIVHHCPACRKFVIDQDALDV